MKEKLLVSFSGGLTSARMTKWILDNLASQYEIVVIFANTGKEREETLEFVNKCDKLWGFNTIWVEAVVFPEKGKGTSYKVVSYETASRHGEPFEQVIIKYGLPNVKFPHCTRELKQRPMHSYVKIQLGWKKYKQSYFTAIGIRIDEVDRVSSSYKKNRYIYPLVSLLPTTKKDIYKFWIQQPFSLNLKSYQGNCDLCFKKSDRKIFTILKESPEKANWWKKNGRYTWKWLFLLS